jgi:CelD/BcsL family acetyltransferase involved in cellulose biosynthesis
MRAPLTVSIIDQGSELERMRGEWEQLLGRSAGLHPSLTPTWLLAWWRVFGPRDGRRLRTLAVRDAQELVGLFPLLERRYWYYGLVPMKRVEPMASGEDAADEIVSEYLGPIVASGREDEVMGAIADRLAADRAHWEELVLPALDGQSPAVLALEPALRARGLQCESKVSGRCPFIALPKRWEDYLGALSSDDRYMAKRSLRDFERWAGKSAKVEVAASHDDLPRAKEILHRLHEHRWQAGGQTGVFVSPVFRRFHDLVMPALLDRGELDLRWLMANGEPVAVSYSIVDDGRIFFYQGGRATEVPKGVRPGIVLHLYAIKAAIEAGRAEYDFLAGDARYKQQLSTGTRTLVELRVTHPSVPELARVAVSAGRAFLAKARERARLEWAEWERKRQGGAADQPGSAGHDGGRPQAPGPGSSKPSTSGSGGGDSSGGTSNGKP